jgi:large subunit ribosomal protein L21
VIACIGLVVPRDEEDSSVYAVIETGGKQYRVEPGQVLVVEKLPGEPGDELAFDNLLMVVADGDEPQVGTPYVPGAKVVGTVVAQERAKKILVFKYKPKSNYRRRRGHRQWQTRVRIDRIESV